jgi:hypothetical protein
MGQPFRYKETTFHGSLGHTEPLFLLERATGAPRGEVAMRDESWLFSHSPTNLPYNSTLLWTLLRPGYQFRLVARGYLALGGLVDPLLISVV